MSGNQHNAGIDPRPEPEVKYVLSGQPTGWAAMEKEVRDFDEEKVKSCKEDIDTLLVFVSPFPLGLYSTWYLPTVEAGLFSAVLSAFLVAEYPALQPDRTAMMLNTLERIAAQTAGYDIVDGKRVVASSTSPPLAPFQASAGDIRVNILWFSSLILSLITASFAMLVKQWLREFLAVEVPSPQARLRIRHLREPQVKGWMVYEIAATLPLLLQLALALFFVGLCYFTASVHSSVELTTLPLVVAWALFFFTATLLPLFFPICPYKTTLLKTLFAGLHRILFSLAGRKWTLDERVILESDDKDVEILSSVDAIQANDEILGTSITDALHYLQPDWKQAISFVFKVVSRRTGISSTFDRAQDSTEFWPFDNPSPLSLLRRRTRDALGGILSGTLEGLKVAYNGNERPNLFLGAFAIALSYITTVPESQLSVGLVSFCRFYLFHEEYSIALFRDLLKHIYLPGMMLEGEKAYKLHKSWLSPARQSVSPYDSGADLFDTVATSARARLSMDALSRTLETLSRPHSPLRLELATVIRLYETAAEIIKGKANIHSAEDDWRCKLSKRAMMALRIVFAEPLVGLISQELLENSRTIGTRGSRDPNISTALRILVESMGNRFNHIEYADSERRRRLLHHKFGQLLLVALNDNRLLPLVVHTLIENAAAAELGFYWLAEHSDDLGAFLLLCCFRSMANTYDLFITAIVPGGSFDHLISLMVQDLAGSELDLYSTMKSSYVVLIILTSLRLDPSARKRAGHLLSVYSVRIRHLVKKQPSILDDGHWHIPSFAHRCLSVINAKEIYEDSMKREHDSVCPNGLVEVLTILDSRSIWVKIQEKRIHRQIVSYAPDIQRDPVTGLLLSPKGAWRAAILTVVRLKRIGVDPCEYSEIIQRYTKPRYFYIYNADWEDYDSD